MVCVCCMQIWPVREENLQNPWLGGIFHISSSLSLGRTGRCRRVSTAILDPSISVSHVGLHFHTTVYTSSCLCILIDLTCIILIPHYCLANPALLRSLPRSQATLPDAVWPVVGPLEITMLTWQNTNAYRFRLHWFSAEKMNVVFIYPDWLWLG